MGIKIIAIGNRIMKDDGVAIHIIEELKDELIHKNLKVIIGETDVEACLDEIHEGDFVIIVDASYFNVHPGTVSVFELKDLNLEYKKGISQHDFSLIKAIKISNKKIFGYFIGIEIGEINFGLELSDVLSEEYLFIVDKVRHYIVEILEGVKNA